MADSSTGELCEKSDSSEKGTPDTDSVKISEAKIEAANVSDIIAHEAANVGTLPADEVNGAAALATPRSSSDFDNFGAELLSDGDGGIGGVIREFKGVSIYSEVGKSNFAPSNFQASFMLARRDSQSVAIVTYLTPTTHLSHSDLQSQSHWGEGRSNSDVTRHPSPLSAIRPRMRANQTLATQHRPAFPAVSASPAPAAAAAAPFKAPILNISSPVKELNPAPPPPPVIPAASTCAAVAPASTREEEHFEARIESANRLQSGLYNWQSSKSTIKERLEAMLLTDLLADVYFVVGRGGTQQKVPAHKFVLSIGMSHSPRISIFATDE